MLPTIPAAKAAELLREGATLVDLREADEHAREHVPGARLLPLSRLDAAEMPADGTLLFHCQSGARTAANAGRLAAKAAGREAYLVEGGIEALKRDGVAVAVNRAAPLPIMRQVQIGAGGLVLLGVLLGALVHPGFIWLAGFVGAGLLFAGLSGFCGLALLLQRMPWNRVAG